MARANEARRITPIPRSRVETRVVEFGPSLPEERRSMTDSRPLRNPARRSLSPEVRPASRGPRTCLRPTLTCPGIRSRSTRPWMHYRHSLCSRSNRERMKSRRTAWRRLPQRAERGSKRLETSWIRGEKGVEVIAQVALALSNFAGGLRTMLSGRGGARRSLAPQLRRLA